jgi:capsular polysaccharide transport system ATP-binding protein
VIIVSHSIHTVKSYCERCAVLRDGKLHYFESVDDAERFYEAA